METKLIDIAVETDPEYSYVVGRNGSYWITKLRVRESVAGPHVYIIGIGKRGHGIRGGFMVTKECFVEVARRFLALRPLLDERELGTVLAALRLWQETVNRHQEPQWQIATDDGQIEALSDDEIDNFCVRLNCSIPDCEVNADGFCSMHQVVHLRERAEAMGVPAAAERGEPALKSAKGRMR
jgi:hypothetical protein